MRMVTSPEILNPTEVREKISKREKSDGAARVIPLRASSTSGKKLAEETPAVLSAISYSKY